MDDSVRESWEIIGPITEEIEYLALSIDSTYFTCSETKTNFENIKNRNS